MLRVYLPVTLFVYFFRDTHAARRCALLHSGMDTLEHPRGSGNVVIAAGAKENNLPYLLRAPSFSPGSNLRSLVVFLHGAGESGTSPWCLCPGFQADAPAGWVASSPHPVRATPPCQSLDNAPLLAGLVVLAPVTKAGWDKPATQEKVMRLVDDVISRYHVNPHRVFLTGISMGGAGTFSIGSSYPERFAALAPICGWASPHMAAALSRIPMYIAHGDNDKVIAADRSRAAALTIRNAGNAKVELRILIGANPAGYAELVGHDSWTQTYGDPKFWVWMNSQKNSR